MSIENIRQMQAKTQNAREQMRGMESMLERLPPEARAELEARMGKKMGGESKSVRIKKTGQSKTINGFHCEEYLIKDKSEKNRPG
jgi:hypothetical protein